VDALLGEAHVARIARLALRGGARWNLVDGGAVAVESSGLGIRRGTRPQHFANPETEPGSKHHEHDAQRDQQTFFQFVTATPPVGVSVQFKKMIRLIRAKHER